MSSRETIVINTRADRDKVARWANGVSEGTIVEFRKKTRSHEQSAKMHAMLGEVADQVIWYGSKLKVEDWKNMFTASLRKAQVVPGIDAGTVVPLGIHTSTMTVDEMSNMIEAIYAFGSEPEHPVVFKEPKEPDSASVPSGETSDAGSMPAPEGDGVADPPSSASSPSTVQLTADDRRDLMECCGKLLFIAVDPDLPMPTSKRGVLETSKNAWKAKLRPELHDHLKSFFVSADAIIKAEPGNAAELRASAITEFAFMLECAPEEIGGA